MDRYITIPAIKTEEGEIIPFYDKRLIFDDGGDEYSASVTIEKTYCRRYINFIDVYFDLLTKQIVEGIKKEYYPCLNDIKYKIGSKYLIESIGSDKMKLDTLIDIQFLTYQEINRIGSKLQNYEINIFLKDEDVNDKMVYHLVSWEPTYIFENGFKTKYEMYIKELVE